MIIQVECVRDYVGDAFSSGLSEKFESGRRYALPDFFVRANGNFFKLIDPRETKPLRQAVEIKGNNRTSKRARNARRAEAKPQNQ